MAFSTNRPLGVPEGGLTSQALVKLSNNDYDVAWGIGSGGGGTVISVFGRTGDINAQSGDYTSDQVTELSGATNQYFTNTRARAAFSNTAPINYSAGAYSITQASTSTSGYLSSTDWNTFNNKGTGTVTSVALSVPSWLTVSAAVTTTGTLAITATSGQTTNQVMATPDGATGAMSLRALVANDIPNLDASKITSGYLAPAFGGAGVPFYGDGSDGNVTISGTVTLVRDMYYNNLTVSGAGNIINTVSYRIFVSGTLDLTGAVINSISRNATVGGNASGATGGTAGAALTAATLGASGSAGGIGATGTTGTGAAGTASTAVTTTLGGTAGTSGAGGGLAAVGTAGVASGAASTNRMAFIDANLIRGAALYTGSTGGSGGSAGTGNGVSAGGGGGGGASGSCIIAIFANIIKRDGTTAAGAISCNGALGGNGGNAVAGGGGGGGAGSAGGCIYIVYNSLQGSTGTNILRANGGGGGTGGTGTAGYFGGTGGAGGNGGRIIVINASTGVVTEVDGTQTTALTPTAPTGTAGTAGTLGVTTQASL